MRPSLQTLHQNPSLQIKGVAALERTDQEIQEQCLGGGFFHGFNERARMNLWLQAKAGGSNIVCLQRQKTKDSPDNSFNALQP